MTKTKTSGIPSILDFVDPRTSPKNDIIIPKMRPQTETIRKSYTLEQGHKAFIQAFKILEARYHSQYRAFEALLEYLGFSLFLTTETTILNQQTFRAVQDVLDLSRIREIDDYLLKVFTTYELGNVKGLGQCLTPPQVADFMIQMVIGTDLEQRKQQKNPQPLTVAEPACGTGVFIIRTWRMFQNENIVFYCADIDLRMYRSTLVQTQLFNIPAYVLCVDSLGYDLQNPDIWALANRWNPPFREIEKFSYINKQQK